MGEKWSVKDLDKLIHPQLSGEQAVAVLNKIGRNGSFLVRKSASGGGEHTIAVRVTKEICLQIKIYNTGEYYDVYSAGPGSPSSQFTSLAAILQHYRFEENDLADKKTGNRIEFLFPLLNETEPFNDKWFHGTMSREHAEELLKENGKPFCFLVRERRDKSSEFVISLLDKDLTCQHVKVQLKGGKYSVEVPGGVPSIISPNLSDLVHYYTNNDKLVANGTQTYHLGEPVLLVTVNNIKPGQTVSKQKVKPKAPADEEFAELQREETKNLQRSRSEGQKPENRERNRYKNILPYDKTRVVLQDGDKAVVGSDYINANYISMVDGQKQYIATQGCLQATVSDFWRMIWQENTRIIVMVTDLVEVGKNKCAQYWPKDKSLTYYPIFHGRIGVQVAGEKSSSEYKIRQFKLSYEKEESPESGNFKPVAESRTIIHYHFTAWPDKSLPKRAESLVHFLIEILKKQAEIPQAGPVVVHCSAGIGRTGTFIVIGFIYEEVRKGGGVNVLEIVRKIREQRSGMVQTEAQYKYLYDVLEYFRKSKDDQQAVYANLPGPSSPSDSAIYENCATQSG